MKPIKLNIKTKSETYPIIIGSKIIKNLSLYLRKNSIHFDKLGLVEGKTITLKNDLKISIDDIKEGYKKWLKDYMVN